MLAGPPPTAPSRAEVGHAVVRRVLVPAVVLWLVVVGVGFLLVSVLALPEVGVNEALVRARTPVWDTVSAVLSGLGTTEALIGTCVVVVGLVWWRTRRWWFAVVPAIALTVQTAVFLTSSLVVGRERPDVPRLDEAPPTSGFPSGHSGASTAFYVACLLCATRIRTPWLRVLVQVVCALVPLAVGVARVYRGMHFPSDVLAGFAVGIMCAVIGWLWLPSRPAGAGRAG